MKKIATYFGVVLAISLCAVLAKEKENSKIKKASAATVAEHRILTPADLTWVDAPPGLPPGGKMAVLDGDPTKKGSFTVRLQTPAGYKIAPHRHPTAERITVISGTFRIGMGDKFDEAALRELGPGAFAVMPAGMSHFASSNAESIVQIHSEGPFQINYVNPADDPRKAPK
jgi:quercetin dioxygenase-like cupin family protein